MSILLPGGRAWLVANWVSFGFFHDAHKYLREGSRLARYIEFCIGAELDTLDARAADLATLVELNDIVGRVARDNRAAGPAGFHDPAGYPVYLEKLGALEAEVAAALADRTGAAAGSIDDAERHSLYCKMYVDSSLDKESLLDWLAGALGGTVERRTVTTPELEVDVSTNDAHEPADTHGRDQFLYFRYLLDIEPAATTSRAHYVATIASLLQSMWKDGMRAVAACDFEHELPRRGGIDSHWPELTRRLAAHTTWDATAGAQGEQLSWPDADLRGLDLSGLRLACAELPASNLEGATLVGTDLYACNLASVSFRGALLERAVFTKANADNADFSGARLDGGKLFRTSLVRAIMAGTRIRGGDLRHASLLETNLSNADLREVLLERAWFEETRLLGADLRGASGAELAHVRSLVVSINAEPVRLEGDAAKRWLVDASKHGSDRNE